MGWVLTGLGVILAVVVLAGAALVLCRRYCGGWQWGARNVWSICDEWRQRLSWLWAPREEKVGLVKAQHPTAQTVPGLYREAGSGTSQYLLHSESDLKLDAQGAFTRFEAVDRDLHPPIVGGINAIPPQPLRPAPQPRSTARPRPSPLQAPSAAENLRLQETGPGPLTPPPTQAQSFFRFQPDAVNGYSPYKAATKYEDPNINMTVNSENIQMTSYPYETQNQQEAFSKYEVQRTKTKSGPFGTRSPASYFPQFDPVNESQNVRYNLPQSQPGDVMYGGLHEMHGPGTQRDLHGRLVRNEARGSANSFGMQGASTTAQTIMESIYGPQTASKMLQSSQNMTEMNENVNANDNQVLGMEMTPLAFRAQVQNATDGGMPYGVQNTLTRFQGLQGVSQIVYSLGHTTQSTQSNPSNALNQTTSQDHEFEFQAQSSCEGWNHPRHNPTGLVTSQMPSFVPPSVPSQPPNGGALLRKNEPTTGEKIFNALRSVTSQSYIDASEFYNSVLSSAQQVQRFTFPPAAASSMGEDENVSASPTPSPTPSSSPNVQMRSQTQGVINSERRSDLYSPELNLEAHRTAQEVYNSLQDPPSSPLLLKDLSQEPHPYLTDPSFTRTSEDIFNSIEQRRKSMERLNGLHEFADLNAAGPPRRRSSQDLYAALEEVQMKRRLSQVAEDPYTGYAAGEIGELSPAGRRGSQGPEPEPPPDEATLKRALSCDSVCSDTSVVLGDLEETLVVGHVCVGLEHERWGSRGGEGEGDLAVCVLEARDLVAPDGRPAQDTFARVCLLPDRQAHVQTRLYRCSPSPSYQEKFLFPLDGGPVGRTLLVEVFSVEVNMGGGGTLLGEASLKLGPAPRPPATTWLPLAGPSLPFPHLGELMFSLSYLPTAERLTLVVVKARNLRGANPLPGDTFVKVYLLQHGKKMHKKKTSTKKGDKSPIFNEAIIFSVPPHALQAIQLRLTVAETTGEPRAYSVGHVIVGSLASGKALAHWRQMLTALRRPVAMWHPLRK